MPLTRRELFGIPLGFIFAGMSKSGNADERKKVAAIVTEYWYYSHADVIVGRLIAGYDRNGENQTPLVNVVSMFTDHVPTNDKSREVASQYGIQIFPTISEALTLGGENLAVDGVVLIGEHGDYPTNEKEQIMYPHYRFFSETTDVFRKSGRAVPLYSDKDISIDWDEAQSMFAQSVELGFPMMAGSSLPVCRRRPQFDLPLEIPIEKAVVSCYGPIERYGFHGLETLQCMVERRLGGETGIAAVQLLEGSSVWNWTDGNEWAKNLLDVSLKTIPNRKTGDFRNNVSNPVVFIVEYYSGLEAAVYLLNGHITSFGFAADITGVEKPTATEFKLSAYKSLDHFDGLVYHIERLIEYGITPYPVKRTLLTTGALIAGMESRYQGYIRFETPHLNITYTAPEDSGYYRKDGVLVSSQNPIKFALSQNYPNPFNPKTTIAYSLPHDTHVTISICNVSGQLVRVLKDDYQEAGNHSVIWNASDMPTGLYFCTLNANGLTETRKMVLLK
ncbi:T9SS type A sorting domain-containing protein [Candidatus Latescibacterota bacterium]